MTPGLTPPKIFTAFRCWKRCKRARSGAGLDVCEGGDGDELAARRLDLEVEERADARAIGLADLRNDLVAAVEVVEAIDVAAAEQRAELLADAGQIEPEIGDLLAIDDDARLRQVDLQIRVHVQELAALPAGADDGRHAFQKLLGRRITREHELHVVLARSR